MVIKNCLITKSNVTISKTWDMSENNLHTGVDIPASDVYAICEGVVIQIGVDNGMDTVTVTVQYDGDRCVRYCNMLTCVLSLGQAIPIGTRIGTAKQAVHFEYATSTKPGKSSEVFPVRINSIEYYKHDPMPVLTGEVKLPSSLLPNVNRVLIHSYNDKVALTSKQSREFDCGLQSDELDNGGMLI